MIPSGVECLCDELAAPLARYRRSSPQAAQVTIPLSGVQHIESPASCGLPSSRLLTRFCLGERASRGSIARAIVYLHGFPDQSLDHRLELPSYGSLGSRFARKLSEQLLTQMPDAVFVAFNFSGTPGSDAEVSFNQKTVSRELADACAVLAYLRQSVAPTPVPVHVVGLSTGAIVASLLRGADPQITVAVIAGLHDVAQGLRFDFESAQLAAFDANGWCWKGFWLPTGSPSNPSCMETDEGCTADDGESLPSGIEATWRDHHLRLDAAYRDDFLRLDIQAAVRDARAPFLVIHGDADRSVPLASGIALFEAAAEPKQMIVIPGANHLLTSTKHFSRAARAVAEHALSVVS